MWGVAPGQTMEVTLPGKHNSGPNMQQVMTGAGRGGWVWWVKKMVEKIEKQLYSTQSLFNQSPLFDGFRMVTLPNPQHVFFFRVAKTNLRCLTWQMEHIRSPCWIAVFRIWWEPADLWLEYGQLSFSWFQSTHVRPRFSFLISHFINFHHPFLTSFRAKCVFL